MNPIDNFSIIYCQETLLPIFSGVTESYPGVMNTNGISFLVILTIIKNTSVSHHAAHYSHAKVSPADKQFARVCFEPLLQQFRRHHCPSLRVHELPKHRRITPATIIRTVYDALMLDELPVAINANLTPIKDFGTFHVASDFSGMEGPSYSTSQWHISHS